MNIWRKKTVRYVLRDKIVPKGTLGASKQTVESKRFYGTLRTSEGKRKQVPLTDERDTSQTLLRRLQTEEDSFRAAGVSRQTRERLRPLSELLDEYIRHLRSKANTERHVTQTATRIRTLLSAINAKTLEDVTSVRISDTLSVWRQRGRPTKRRGIKRESVSVQTSNHYARAIKGFTRWLWIERKTQDDCLSPLRLLNADADRRRQRRALTPDELQRLLKATSESGKRIDGLRPADRTMLYTLAAYTGLRASELASLNVQSVDLNAKTISVAAAYSKRRRSDTLPLHASLLAPLQAWLSTKTGTLFPGAWASKRKAAGMLRSDLRRAGIAYVDAMGRVADFHALRHTFVSQLAKSGVHPSKAKELARHSTITLTMDVYSHVETEELRTALDSLPPLA